MIKIKKSAKPPKALKAFIRKGEVENRENCAAYDRSPEDYRSGREKFEFNAKIYGSRTVKNALLHAQHGKCCYCESKFRANSPGDVEHYRPKRAVKQRDGQSIEYPGYYWLAYDWNNLLVSCEVCNRSHKKNLFPLKNPDARARSHHERIADERPLFINPGFEDPRKHIRFQGPTLFCCTEFGRAMIDGMDLNRHDLKEDRRSIFNLLRGQCDIVRLGATRPDDLEFQALVRKAQTHLSAAVRPEAQYSSMALDLVKALEGVRDGEISITRPSH